MSNKEARIVAVTMSGGVEVLGELIKGFKGGSVTVKNPQMYIAMTNQFIPLFACQNVKDRVFKIPSKDVILWGDAIPYFAEGYKATYPQQFMSEEELNEMKLEAKAKIDKLEQESPVHGGDKVESKSGIILS